MKKKEDFFKDDMASLVKQYRASLPEKIHVLSDLVAQLIKDPSKDNIKKLRDEIHKLAGSGGMYGFSEVSDLCKKEVIVLDDWLEAGAKKHGKKEDFHRLITFINKLESSCTKQETRLVEEEIKVTPLLKGDDYTHDLFLAYFDEDVLRLVEKEAKIRNLRILTLTEPDEIIKKWRDTSFHPRTVIVGKCFSKKPKMEQRLKQSFDPVAFLKESKLQKKGALLGIILPETELSLRLLVMKEGIDYVIDEPVVVDRIFEVVESAIPAYFEKSFKVLLIEKDPEVSDFIFSVLESINVEVKILHSSSTFFETLAKFRPNLVMLDVKIDGESGVDVLKAIRKDPEWTNMPVIMITPILEDDTVIAAYKERVDDFIVKPIIRSVLQSKVLRFAYLHSFQETQQVRESLTGMYAKRAFIYSIAKQIGLIPSQDLFASVALISFLHYDELKKKNGGEVDRIVVELSNYLKRTFPDKELMARYEEDTFAIYFETSSAMEIKKVLEEAFLHCPISVKGEGKREKRVSLAAGIAMFPYDGKTGQDVLKNAEKYLVAAKKLGPGFVACSQEEVGKRITKEIFLLDDDVDICSILSFSFAKQGFKVTVSYSLQEAEEMMKKRHISEFPALFILDRMLPDGDGLEFYREMKREYEAFPPVLFLSRLSAEKDVMAGLKEGAIDYIAKPFSMSILLEKALRLLKQ